MTDELTDREVELRLLERAGLSPPSLVVMRGRRRVGKSFLLSKAFDGARAVSFQAEQQDEGNQLQLFAREMARLLPGAPGLSLSSWDEALELVAAQAVAEPLVVILDEFQWLCEAQPALPSKIQRHWDEWQRRGLAITLVLCGSALSFMEGLLGHEQPLYGRAGYRPLLEPLDYRWSARFSAAADPEELLRRYAVLGGTPQYQVWAGSRPLSETIAERILAKGAPLYEEPLNLLRAEGGIRDPGTYFSILRAVAEGATRNNEIANRCSLTSDNAARKLGRLEELGYLELRAPLAPKERGRRSIYRISDPYFRFWFRYVFPNRSRLDQGRVDEVLAEVLGDLDNYMGPAFEDCCRQWVGAYADEDSVGANREVGAWWSRDGQVEIDIVGLRKTRYGLLGSVKWSREVSEAQLDDLRRQRRKLGSAGASARLALFARESFSTSLRRRAKEEGVLLVTAADLFA
jgi:uncharacterized protein